MPSAERFALQAGRLGIGDGTHVVVYAQDSPMWATRLWWQLRYFGFDAVSVLDGGLPAWKASGRPLRSGAAEALEAAGALGERPVIAYCGGGISATVDLFALSLVGRDDARLYDGSLTEWTRDPALPVEVG